MCSGRLLPCISTFFRAEWWCLFLYVNWLFIFLILFIYFALSFPLRKNDKNNKTPHYCCMASATLHFYFQSLHWYFKIIWCIKSHPRNFQKANSDLFLKCYASCIQHLSAFYFCLQDGSSQKVHGEIWQTVVKENE